MCSGTLLSKNHDDEKKNNSNIEFIKNNLKINKKYTLNENLEQFKRLLINTWIADRRAEYAFMKNGEFSVTNIDYECYNLKGRWLIKDNMLILYQNKNKFTYRIEYYKLEYHSILPIHKYNFSIKFDKELYMAEKYLVIDFD